MADIGSLLAPSAGHHDPPHARNDVMVRAAATLLVLLVEVWALMQVLGSPASMGRKLRWSAVIVLLPVLGIVLWLRKGPRPSPEARHMV